MEWFTENWIWILLIGGMLAIHLFGHGGHGGHGANGGRGHGGGGCGGGHGRKPAEKAEEPGPSAGA